MTTTTTTTAAAAAVEIMCASSSGAPGIVSWIDLVQSQISQPKLDGLQ